MGGNGSDLDNVGNASKFVTAIMNNNGTTDYTRSPTPTRNRAACTSSTASRCPTSAATRR